MTKTQILLVIGIILYRSICYAQIDSLIQLPELEVLAIKSELSDELNTISINSSEISSINSGGQQALASKLGIYLKAYGFGQVSTMSFRGGNSGQLLTLWNGMPINNSMLGSYDLSIAPISLVQEISLSRTNQSHLWGSGAITGALQFENLFQNNPDLNISSSTEVGSFGQFAQRLNVNFGKGKYSNATTVLYSQSENDFKYTTSNQLRNRNEHAFTKSQQMISSHKVRLKANNTIEAHIWLQNVYKENPPTLTQTENLASLQDQNQRYLIKWKKKLKKWTLNAHSGYSSVSNLYIDPILQLNNDNHFTQWHNQAVVKWLINDDHSLGTGVDYEIQAAKSENYHTDEDFRTYNAYANYQFKKDKHFTQITLQKQWNQRITNSNPQIDLSYGYQINKSISIQANASINAYRVPSLNDLYWVPGGNPNLLPEVADEFSLTIDLYFNGWSFNSNIYHRQTENWIFWAPISEGLWGAQNLAEIVSKGVDIDLKGSIINHSNYSITFEGRHTYTLSSSKTEIELPRLKIGEQLAYVPKHQSYIRINSTYSKLELGLEEIIRSQVRGISDKLSSYTLTNLYLAYYNRINRSKINYRIIATINNLFDSSYLLYENRPQPGRHYSINFTIDI